MIDDSLLELALAEARRRGAEYAEARAEERTEAGVHARNGAVQRLTSSTDRGWGLRVAVGGGWGFAGTVATDPASVADVAQAAVDIARASATRHRSPVDLSAMPSERGEYATQEMRDPLAVPVEERIALMLDCSNAMQTAHERVKVAVAHCDLVVTDKLFVNTSGAHLRQHVVESGAWLEATAVDETGYAYNRSFGNMHQAGWEFIESLRLPHEAARVGAEAGTLVAAEWAPSGPTTAVIGSDMMSLLVHESCGHPTELDRVLGWEAAFAGTSFLLPDMLGHFRYGSPVINLTADALTPGGLGTYGWDDEGTPAQKTPIVREGLFVGYLTSRDTAPAIGQASNGCSRATSWGRIPIVRMTNLSLAPGQGSLADLLGGVEDGLYLETPSSWSLDDKRMNFHFSVEMCREIKNGAFTGRVFKGASFQNRTPLFWGAVDAVAGPEEWTLWGFPGCAKGEPLQSCHVAHGAAPVRVPGMLVVREG
jgi:TldD protein